MTSIEKAKKIVELMDNKKAIDIKVLRVSELTSVADYFVICSAGSVPQSDAIVTEIEDELLKLKVHHRLLEGNHGCGWILMDYEDVIVHVFLRNERSYYDIERIWRDAPEEKLI